MKHSIKYLLFSGLLALLVFPVYADGDGKDMFNPITTGVTTLNIAPDARGGSMGDLGVATDPDVNSQYWNPSKYAFAFSSAGFSVRDGLALLEEVHQEGIWATRVSFVYSVREQAVYYTENNRFDRIQVYRFPDGPGLPFSLTI